MTIWDVSAAASKPDGLLVCHAAAAPQALHGFKLARAAQIGLLAPGIHVFVWHESVLISNALTQTWVPATAHEVAVHQQLLGEYVCICPICWYEWLKGLLLQRTESAIYWADISDYSGTLCWDLLIGTNASVYLVSWIVFPRVAYGERLCAKLHSANVIPRLYM